jgi:hypothetical protein
MPTRYRAGAALVCLSIATASMAQETIPEAVARGATSRASTPGSGRPEALTTLLRRADVIVRGVVGVPRSYLSDDRQSLFSDYPIQNPVYVYRREEPVFIVPGVPPPLLVTIRGGRIEIGGVLFTESDGSLPRLMPGADVVLVLERTDGKYRPAGGGHLGAFAVVNERLVRLTGRRGFAPEMEGRIAVEAIAEMTRIATASDR